MFENDFQTLQWWDDQKSTKDDPSNVGLIVGIIVGVIVVIIIIVVIVGK